MNYPMPYALREERSAIEFQAALDTVKKAAEKVSSDFVENLPPRSLAYDVEWRTRHGSDDQLIFVFTIVLDLEESLDLRDYPREAVKRITADLRKRLAGTKVDSWGTWVVTATARPKLSTDD